MKKYISFNAVCLKNNQSQNEIFYYLGEHNFLFYGCEKDSCDLNCLNKCGTNHYYDALKILKNYVNSANNKII